MATLLKWFLFLFAIVVLGILIWNFFITFHRS